MQFKGGEGKISLRTYGYPSFKTKFHLDNYPRAIHVKINM